MALKPEDQAAVMQLLAEFRSNFGAAPLARLEEAFAMLIGLKPRLPKEGHRRARFFFPGLDAKPWHEGGEFPIVERLEADWRIVRDELFGALQGHDGFQQYVHVDDHRGIVPKEWKALYLKHGTETFPANRALCPHTTRMIAGDRRVEELVMFSALNPNGHIKPHGGTWNCRFNVHLGLVIPSHCALRVGDEVRSWQEGRCLVFDDSFEHEAWNRGEHTRFILLVNVWHPGLTDVEVDFLNLASQRVNLADVAAHRTAVKLGKDELRGRRWWFVAEGGDDPHN